MGIFNFNLKEIKRNNYNNSELNIEKKGGKTKSYRFFAIPHQCVVAYLRAAWAAASLAMGTRKGEQLT